MFKLTKWAPQWRPFEQLFISIEPLFSYLLIKMLGVDEVFFNSLRPRWNWQHFSDDIFKRIFFYENVWISIEISLKFVPMGPINNIPALVQIMAWRRPGDKPLSEPMIFISPTHICVTRPQLVNKCEIKYPLPRCAAAMVIGYILCQCFKFTILPNQW